MADKDNLSTGVKLVDDLLSKPLRRGELSVIVGGPSTLRPHLWVPYLEKLLQEDGTLTVDLETSLKKLVVSPEKP